MESHQCGSECTATRTATQTQGRERELQPGNHPIPDRAGEIPVGAPHPSVTWKTGGGEGGVASGSARFLAATSLTNLGHRPVSRCLLALPCRHLSIREQQTVRPPSTPPLTLSPARAADRCQRNDFMHPGRTRFPYTLRNPRGKFASVIKTDVKSVIERVLERTTDRIGCRLRATSDGHRANGTYRLWVQVAPFLPRRQPYLLKSLIRPWPWKGFTTWSPFFFLLLFSDYFSTHRVPSFPSQDAHSRPEARSKLNLAQARGRVLVQGEEDGCVGVCYPLVVTRTLRSYGSILKCAKTCRQWHKQVSEGFCPSDCSLCMSRSLCWEQIGLCSGFAD